MTETSPPILDLQTLQKTAKEKNKTLWHSVTLELQTITPVYGGGTTAGEPDMLLPFRPRAIKNSLRHWWWLINRHKPEYKADSKLLYRDMTAIWGGASDETDKATRTQVRLRVQTPADVDQFVTPYMPFRIITDENNSKIRLRPTLNEPHFYALWMIKPKEEEINSSLQAILKKIEERPGNACSIQNKKFAEKLASIPQLFKDTKFPVRKILVPGLTWSLHLEMAQSLTMEQKIQVKESLSAWLMLGGIGARTTRGLGRSKMSAPPITQTSAFKTLTDKWQNQEQKWFKASFGNSFSIREDLASDAFSSWQDSLRIYKNFRQSRQENENGYRMKQSYGHLANSLRKSTKQEGHPIPLRLKNSQYTPMPELMFGAPINYQFISKNRLNSEPDDGEIHFKSTKKSLERYTSPLLVSTIQLTNGKFAPISLFFKDHYSDVNDKDIEIKIKKESKTFSIAEWWPNISNIDGQNAALELLSEDFRNSPRPNNDFLYEELMDANFREDALCNGDPLAAYINFFREHVPE